MIRLAVFDLDGTLLDSLEDLADAVNYALKKNGFETHPVEKYRYFVGDGAAKLIERVLPEGAKTPENEKLLHDDFSIYYEKHFKDKTAPYSGICEALEKLTGEGIKLAVLSNKPHDFVGGLVSGFFGGSFNAGMWGNREGVRRKPYPDGLKLILDNAGVKPSECVMIGDTSVDIKTARNTGVHSVGCLWGFREIQELKEAGAEAIAENPSELFDIISKMEGEVI